MTVKARVLVLVVALFVLVLAACQSQHFTGAKVYIQQSNWEKAIEQLNIEVQQNPANVEAWFLLGNCYSKKKMFKEMNDAFAECLKLDPTRKQDIDAKRHNEWVPFYNSAVGLMRAGKYEEAVAKIEKAIVIYEEKPGNWVNLGICKLQLQKEDEAVKDFDKAIEIIGEAKTDEKKQLLLTAMKNKAIYYANAEKTDDALKIYQEIVAVDPEDANTWAQIGNCYNIKENYEEAEKAYSKATELDPDNKNLWYNIGVSKYKTKNFDGAIEAFERVLAIDPDDQDALYNASLIYQQNKEFEKAKDALKKLTELYPNEIDYWNQLGSVYINLGEKKSGTEAFNKAMELEKASKGE